MLILHASQQNGNLAVWAEDSQKHQPDTQGTNPIHPACATLNQLEEALGLLPKPQVEMRITVWLPSRNNAPLPSSPLAGPEHGRSRSKPRISPWRVHAAWLTPEQTLRVLQDCHDKLALRPGVAIGPDLAFWTHAMLFAQSLTLRQRFLPTAVHQGIHTLARWTPVFTGEDASRLADLARLMPAAARATTMSSGRAPAEAPQSALKDFLTGWVDHLVRSSGAAGEQTGTETNSVHDAWLQALTGPDPTVAAPEEQLRQLHRQVEEWQQPISVMANSPYRLCLRLEEPPELPGDLHEPEEAPALAQVPEEQWYLRYMLQSHEDHSLLVPAQAVWDQQVKTAHTGFNPAEFLLSSLAQAAALCSPIADSMTTRNPAGYPLDTIGAHQFLQQAATLQQQGFAVMLPALWSGQGTKSRPTIRARAKAPAMQGGSGISMDSLIHLDIDVAVGDQTLSPEELNQLAEFKIPLVRFRGQWVQVNQQEIQAAADFWRRRGELTLRDITRIALGADPRANEDNLQIDAQGWLKEMLASLSQRAGISQLEPPQGFRGTLRPYQLLGYSWLVFLSQWGLGACLADDMGLGKTIQTLAALQRDHQNGNTKPNLLVCPTSVINNWQREAARFTPDLPVLVHHGPQRARGQDFQNTAEQHQVVMTSYGTMTQDQQMLGSVPWRALVLDEAQNIKNPSTQQARAAQTLQTDYRIALTGTPVENHVGDLWSIMQFLNPGLLGTQGQFKKEYFTPIQVNHDQEAASRLHQVTGPFILRRVKTDRSIIDDLPDKLETRQYCPLTREQATLYQAVVREAETRLEDASGMARRGCILDTLTKLKQACNHPRHLLGDNSAIPDRSGKLTRLEELLEEILSAGDRVLVFSQFAEMATILQTHVQETWGIETPLLHGGVPRKQRDHMVDRFQNDPNGPPVFILSLKAGGLGLNLPRANHVIHYDRWWNPAVENQATDRAFRIGQTRDVHVHKLICAGTLEDSIDAMIESKQQTAEQVVGTTSERWLTELSNTEIRDILALRATPTG